MDIEEDIKIVKEFNKKNRFRDCGRLNNAIDNILEEIEENRKYTIHLTDEQYRKTIENAQKDVKDKYKKKIEELEEIDEANRKVIAEQCDYIQNKSIPKQKVKEGLEKAEKENEPYELHNKESRMYWLNQGKISLAKKILEDK